MKLGFLLKKWSLYGMFMLLLLNIPMTLEAKDRGREMSLEEAIQQISVQYGVYFTYNKRLINDFRVDFDVDMELSLEDAVNKVLSKTSLHYKIHADKYVIIYKTDREGIESLKEMVKHLEILIDLEEKKNRKRISLLPTKSIKSSFEIRNKRLVINTAGVVTDQSGQPLIGVNVLVKGSDIGTATDFDGRFTLEDIDENAVLVVSYVGYVTQEIPVLGKSNLQVVLLSDSELLDEVVVVGYGTQRKGELTVAVSQIKGEDIESIQATSFMDLIGGRAAGVDVVSGSGAPGSGSTIRIRGANSINSNSDPLYVIDGFPVIEDAEDNFSNSKLGTKTDPLSMINPNDIASIEILKDAAATSIYGSRGANGVILITTKKGGAGKSEIQLTANVGIQQMSNNYEMMNATDFSHYLYDAYDRGGIDMENLGFDPSRQLAIPTDYNTDWVDEITRTAKVQQYDLSFKGSNNSSKYGGSIGYLNNEGIIKSNFYERFSARFNGDIKGWEDRIVVGLNVNMSYVNQNSHYGVTNTALTNALRKAPNIPVRFPAGSKYAGYYSHSETEAEWDVLWGDGYGVASSTALNLASPFQYIDHIQSPANQARLLTNGYFSIEPIDGLVFKTSAGTDLNYSKSKFLNQSDGPFRIPNGDLQHDQTQTTSWLIENTVTFSKQFGQHSFNLLGGQSAQKYYQEGLGWWVQEQTAGEVLVANNPFFVDGWYFDTGVEDHLSSNHKYATVNEFTVASYFGRLNYSFDNKYLLTATLRKDGSSKFGKNSKWGTFPGLSMAWNIHEENFYNVDFVDQLKVRGSWGIVGNGNIPPYLSQALLVKRPAFLIGAVISGTGIYEQSLVDPGLSWESTQQYDFGFDAILFNRLSVTSDIYFKKTFDLLYPLILPQSTGFSSITMTNLGSLNQVGVELTLSGDIIPAKRADGFNWFASLNIDHSKGKITELPDNVDWVGNNIRSYLNQPIGELYGYKVAGIYNTQAELDSPDNPYSNAQLGDYRYEDIGSTDENGNFVNLPDGNITAADRTNLGSTVPVLSLGFHNSISFGNFDVNLFFRSSIGNKVYNQAKRELLDANGSYNLMAEAVNRWTPENHNQEIQAANSNRRNPTGSAPLDIFIEDGSYLRLSNVNLGYSFPQNILKSVGCKSIRLYLSINNAFVLTGYSGLDPEISGGDVLVSRGIDVTTYPKTRTYSSGLSISF
ncbi:SusC/RagA family TonB-linked outer membrane protein [Membranihabitans marinus]|uniref:SusC/RagA family TonB-linked outer membrane protein n=1 Tax=Membranihabitans marinus TaxID=1227546 RepID=UPI001EFFF648|nr:SusC/RagA family TonB-linked outer membrane protein [Membranihabitans marinus]